MFAVINWQTLPIWISSKDESARVLEKYTVQLLDVAISLWILHSLRLSRIVLDCLYFLFMVLVFQLVLATTWTVIFHWSISTAYSFDSCASFIIGGKNIECTMQVCFQIVYLRTDECIHGLMGPHCTNGTVQAVDSACMLHQIPTSGGFNWYYKNQKKKYINKWINKTKIITMSNNSP